jgi:hypothetical protein
MQYLVYSTTPPAADAPPPSMEVMMELGKLTADGLKAGVLVATGALEPKGTRLRLSNGQFSVTDGPYIELKELMAGWALLRVNSLEEAVEWSKRFLAILGGGESEIVRVYGPEDGPG